jgi:hypothetical protein
MKKYIIALVAMGVAASVLAQGTVNYNIRVTGAVVGHVYGPESATEPGKYASKFGNTATETPGGTQTYAGGFLTGSGWYAQLFAANLAGQAEGSLTAVANSVVSFRTGSTLGGTIVTSNLQVPQVPEGGTGTFQLRVWNNVGGTLTTWAQAEAQWLAGNIAAGKSTVFDVAGLGGGIVGPADMLNFRSFNVYFMPIPEPSTFALLGLGALGMLIFRRK